MIDDVLFGEIAVSTNHVVDPGVLPGERVRVKSGTYKGLCGTFEEKRPFGLAVVRVTDTFRLRVLAVDLEPLEAFNRA